MADRSLCIDPPLPRLLPGVEAISFFGRVVDEPCASLEASVHQLRHTTDLARIGAVETTAQRINAMNEKSIDQIEEEVLICEISDEAVEAAGTRTEIAGVWTFVCTSKHCSHPFALKQ